MPTNGQGPGLGQIWDPNTMRFETPVVFNQELGSAFNISEDVWKSLPVSDQTALVDRATELGYTPPTQTGASAGLGGWFKDNKDMIGAGLGAAQLGLGILNYNQNKKALKSELESAEQARRLNEERAQNKRTIQNKAQTALRFDI